MPLRPCLDCGRLARSSRCRICTATRNRANPYRNAAWRHVSREVVERDRACVRCGSAGPYLNAHHVTARAQGGPDTPHNLVTLCVSCHACVEAQQRAA